MYFLKLEDENPLIILIALILAMCGGLYVWLFEESHIVQIIEFVVILFIGIVTFHEVRRGIYTWFKRRGADIQVWLVEEPMVTESDVKVESWVEETSLPPNSLELVYFNIRNRSEIRLKNCRVWINFPHGFRIIRDLDLELQEKNIRDRADFRLGALHRTRKPVKNKQKSPNHDNILYGKEPTLHLDYHAFFEPVNNSATFDVFETNADSTYFPIWIETPKKEGRYSVQIIVSPENIEKEFREDLEIIVESAN